MPTKPSLVRCPTCGKSVPWEGNPHRPFCSERCRTLDLGQWAAEGYRIPGEKTQVPDDTKPKDKRDER